MSQFQIIFFGFILILLILLNIFFSISETALMSVNRYRLRHLARLRKSYATRILHLLKRPDRLLGVILIGSTFTNVLASSLATLIAFHFWGDKGAIITAFLLTFFILIFAEITPKTLAALFPEKVARIVAYPIELVLKILSPFVWIANSIANGVLHLFHVHVKQLPVEPLSREELRTAVYDTGGKISRQFQHMLLSILDLGKLSVNDVMIPRHEIEGINLQQPWSEIKEQIIHSPNDFLPVYEDNINQVCGVLHSKELLNLLLSNPDFQKDAFGALLHDPYFVPEGTPLNIQLAHFQQSQDKMAFVVDEYGEMMGLLTLQDILEEIVGDFTISVSAIKRIQEEADGSYLVEGGVTIREFNRQTNWDLPDQGPRTINGLIIEHLEALPHVGTSILVAGYPIEIIQVKENRVKLARIFANLGGAEKRR